MLDSGTPITGIMLPTTPATKAALYIAHSQVPFSGLIRSFPDEPVAHIYDNALALIVLTDAGKREEAQRLANVLDSLLETNGNEGFFYDAYNAIDRRIAQGTVSGTGPNTWAAFALAYFGQTFGDQNALDSAARVARWVLNKLYDDTDGGIWGGICHSFEERNRDHAGDLRLPFKSTEQVIDTWHLFRMTGHPQEMDRVSDWLRTSGRGWIQTDPGTGGCVQNKRFSTGVNDSCKPDARMFLDPQSWGSILANIAGEPDKAKKAIEAAERYLRVETVVNGKTIQAFGDSCLPKHDIIWYGGRAQMIVAYVFAGDMESARKYLADMLTVQNADGSWDHSSESALEKTPGGACDSYESFHSAKPSLGETAWNYFAFRDVNDGWRLPYMPTTLRIGTAAVVGKQLILTGTGFAGGAKVLLNGEEQATRTDSGSSGAVLVAKKAGKKAVRGQSTILQVVNSDGTRSPQFCFRLD